MTRAHDPIDDRALDGLLSAARDAAPELDEALLARVLADAAMVQRERQGLRTASASARPAGLGARIVAALGGWQGMSTLAACACVGLVLGLSAPDTVMGYVTDVGAFSPDGSEIYLADALLLEEDLQ